MIKITEEAEKIIEGERHDAYGSVYNSFKNTASVWSGILGTQITAEQVALCMIGLKLCRESHSHKRDNLVDIIGYVLLLEKLVNEKGKKN